MGCKSECVAKLFDDEEITKSKQRATDYRNESEYQFIESSEKNPDLLSSMREEAIKYVNMYRSKHNAMNLMLNDELNEIAQKNAEAIAESDTMAPSKSQYRGVILGENLFSSAKEMSSKDIIAEWYNDNQYYNYNNNNNNSGNNFSQLIWKNTLMVGFGFAKKNGWGYCVANFYPAGNIIDNYEMNVSPVDKTLNISKAKGGHNRKEQEFSPSNNPLLSPDELATQFAEDAFIAHNQYRLKHKVPTLKWNDDLCQIAQSYAEELANQNMLQQSNNQYRDEELGESLYMCQGKLITGKEVTATWYNEKDEYDFDKGEFNSNAGHFTQLVWKSTTDVGFGCAQSISGIYYAVANYYPPGNYEDMFFDNVFPSKDDY